MGEERTLLDLAKALTKEERQSLLRKINKSLSIQDAIHSDIYRSKIQPDQKKQLIQKDIENLGLWERFLFWFRRLFSAKLDEEVFIDFQLSQLKRKVMMMNANLTDFETKVMKPETARLVFQLYSVCYPLIPMYRNLWKNPEYLENTVNFLIEEKIPGAKRRLTDFISVENLMDIFQETESKSEIRKEVMRRYKQYTGSIQKDLFAHLEAGILPLYYLKGLCLYPYDDFFSLFNHALEDDVPSQTPRFSSVNVPSVLVYLERLYYALYTAEKAGKNFYLHDELILYYLEAEDQRKNEIEESVNDENSGKEADKEAAAEKEEDSERRIEVSKESKSRRDDEISAVKSDISEIENEALRIKKRFPLPEIIKYYQKDPYYRIQAYVPTLNLEDFYLSALKIKLLSQIDEQFMNVRLGVIKRMKKALFKQPLKEFKYFNSSALQTIKIGEKQIFPYMKPLNVLYNFIIRNYTNSMQNFIRILNRIIPERKRDAQNRLIKAGSGIEEVRSKIEEFDGSFSQETDDGKAYFKLRFSMEKDISQQKSFQNFISGRNREARTLIDNGLEHFNTISEVLQEFSSLKTTGIAERYAAYDAVNPQQNAYSAVLDSQIKSIEILNKLIKQLIAIEEGI